MSLAGAAAVNLDRPQATRCWPFVGPWLTRQFEFGLDRPLVRPPPLRAALASSCFPQSLLLSVVQNSGHPTQFIVSTRLDWGRLFSWRTTLKPMVAFNSPIVHGAAGARAQCVVCALGGVDGPARSRTGRERLWVYGLPLELGGERPPTDKPPRRLGGITEPRSQRRFDGRRAGRRRAHPLI